MTDETGGFIDRGVSLSDVGGGNRLAATLLGWDFTCLAIVDCDRIGDGTPIADPECRSVTHEQLGPLPLEISKRIAIAQRAYRCGRLTESGRPCRITVARSGAACHWHCDTTE